MNDTVGNYNQSNRPRALNRNDLTKALGMFKMYSVNATKFMVTGWNTMMDKTLPPEERRVARNELVGVMGMTFLFAGLQGLPLYTIGMQALQLLQDATDTDEDKRKRMIKNPYTANSVEAQFLYEWLPENFGTPVYTGTDGEKHLLSDIMLSGPLSEASGWNLGSKVSLDLAGLWFRSPKDTSSFAAMVPSALVENIPGASAGMNFAAMADEFQKGNIERGLEQGLPAALLRSPLKAMRYAEEGLRSEKQKVKVAPDKIGNTDILGTALGFNPKVVARAQKLNRDVMDRKQELSDDRSAILDKWTQAYRKWSLGDTDANDALKAAYSGVQQFNKRTSNPYWMISTTDLYNSLRSAKSESKYDVQGMGLNAPESYYVKQMLPKK